MRWLIAQFTCMHVQLFGELDAVQTYMEKLIIEITYYRDNFEGAELWRLN